jgi:hypothetical protein
MAVAVSFFSLAAVINDGKLTVDYARLATNKEISA